MVLLDGVVIQLPKVHCFDLVLLFTQLVPLSFCYRLVITELCIESFLLLRLGDPLVLDENMGFQLVHVHISCVTMFVLLELKLTLWSPKLWPPWHHENVGSPSELVLPFLQNVF